MAEQRPFITNMARHDRCRALSKLCEDREIDLDVVSVPTTPFYRQIENKQKLRGPLPTRRVITVTVKGQKFTEDPNVYPSEKLTADVMLALHCAPALPMRTRENLTATEVMMKQAAAIRELEENLAQIQRVVVAKKLLHAMGGLMP